MRIAILEDDRALAEQLDAALARGGHLSRIFDRGESLLGLLPRDTFDLLLLDWTLPDMSGLDVLRWIRTHATERPMPVILITSRLDGSDIVASLHAGADDYVVKPINIAELLARIAALLRRSFPEHDAAQLRFGHFHFDTVRKRLTIKGEEVALTNKEFRLALLLLANTNRALSRDYLMATVWNSKGDLQTRTLDAHVSRVRAKLGLRPDRGFRLVPIYSYGYRLEALSAADAA